MVTFQNKQILINGKPSTVISGEVHYFRLPRKQWASALDDLVASGANAVATYVPWLCHEFEEGKIDLTGIYREEHDLDYFLSLCEDRGLYIIARPGPFIMAEVKNEGIPYWVHEKYPEVLPTTWNGKKGTTPTLDYLNPNFLGAVKNWYSAVMGLFAKHSMEKGGRLLAVQVDNEIGMLSWCSNCPDLTAHSMQMLSNWLLNTYGKDAACERYGCDITDPAVYTDCFTKPSEDVALKFHKDLGYFSRWRFRQYVHTLKQYAHESGIHNVPFLVNIHGSGGSRGFNYPIGISQLMETWKDDNDVMSGSDFYIGDITIGNFQDVYISNAFTDAANSKDQPLTSMEFETGDGNYSNSYDMRYSPTSIDIKSRMFTAQGNRLLNYYLFSGGINYRMPKKVGDGNDRIAITGEHHGYAAPLGPTLAKGTTHDMTARVMSLLTANGDELATMVEQTDNLVFNFIPDYYMTEYHYPSSQKEMDMMRAIQRVRNNAWSVIAKSLLLQGRTFKALDIQNNELDVDKVLIFTPALYLSKEIQQKVVNFIEKGGKMFLYGEIPLYDMEGNPCTILKDALGIRSVSYIEETHPGLAMSADPCGFAEGYPEIYAREGQVVEVDDADVFLRLYDNEATCGFRKEIGAGKVVCLTIAYHNQLPVMEELFQYLGIERHLEHNDPFHGVFMTNTINDRGTEFLHVINLDDMHKDFDVYLRGEKLFDRPLHTSQRQCLMLPINQKINDDLTIVKSTAEVLGFDEHSITFRLTQNFDTIVLRTSESILNTDLDIDIEGDIKTIRVFSKSLLEDTITIKF